MKVNKITRRHFLQGMGGFSLSLPFLPSLFTRELLAQSVVVNKCFFAMGTEHGGVRPLDIFGNLLSYTTTPEAGLTAYKYLSAGIDPRTKLPFSEHNFHHGLLVNYIRTAAEAGESDDPDAGAKRLSYIIGSKFNSYLPKMNILRGVDLYFGDGGHARTQLLGNYGKQNTALYPRPTIPTIDTLISNSSLFYPSLSGVKMKHMNLPFGPSVSIGSDLTILPQLPNSTKTIFTEIFGTGTVAGNSNDTFIVDRILDDYKRFISPASSTGSRIGAEDKQALNQFLSHLDELERRLTVETTCDSGSPPLQYGTKYDYANHGKAWEAMSYTLALAFACGASRIATTYLDGRPLMRFTPYATNEADFHSEVAHRHEAEDAIPHLRQYHRVAAEEAFYNVIRTLDRYSGVLPGTSMLDQSLCYWQPMSGVLTHSSMNNFALTAGSANGYFNTGRYIDLRSLNNLGCQGVVGAGSERQKMRPGISQNQLMATILQSMGLRPSDYENRAEFGGPGYGYWDINPRIAQLNQQAGVPQQSIDLSGTPIPIWKKS